ncbi:MAG: phosphodiesterase [Pseudomonadota bacterium]
MVHKLIHVTDPHLVAPGGRIYGLDPQARLGACLDHIAGEHGDADLCVISGDLSDTGHPDSYRALHGLLDGFPLPVRLMTGNHDGRANFRAAFPDAPVDPNGFVQSTADLGDERLIFLDTLDEGHIQGLLCAERLAWLESELNAAGDRSVSLFLHHPPLSVCLPHFEKIMLADPEPLMALLRAHGKIRHLFLGHLHLAASGTMEGIPFTVGRGTCHQILATLDDRRATFVDGLPAYNVVLFDDQDLIIHEVEVPERGPVLHMAKQPTRP